MCLATKSQHSRRLLETTYSPPPGSGAGRKTLACVQPKPTWNSTVQKSTFGPRRSASSNGPVDELFGILVVTYGTVLYSRRVAENPPNPGGGQSNTTGLIREHFRSPYWALWGVRAHTALLAECVVTNCENSPFLYMVSSFSFPPSFPHPSQRQTR